MKTKHITSIKNLFTYFLFILACIVFCSGTAGSELENGVAVDRVSATVKPLPPPTSVEPEEQHLFELETASVQSEPSQETEPQMTCIGQYYVTGYDICVECCGKTDGITASGVLAEVGRTVAANNMPFGTRLYIDGIGERVVEDRGGMKDNVLDVLCNDHPECYAITGYYDVYIINE